MSVEDGRSEGKPSRLQLIRSNQHHGFFPSSIYIYISVGHPRVTLGIRNDAA